MSTRSRRRAGPDTLLHSAVLLNYSPCPAQVFSLAFSFTPAGGLDGFVLLLSAAMAQRVRLLRNGVSSQAPALIACSLFFSKHAEIAIVGLQVRALNVTL